ncbi:MAG: packaged DNA stabilization protein [Bacillota bacterium]
MQIPVLNGIYADESADFRTAYPRNMIPVPKDQGISKGYLRPAYGIEQVGAGPGVGRGGINWNGALYRVLGTNLVRIDAAGNVTVLGDVGGSGPVTMDYSFDRLAIASGGRLYYWNGSTLTQVTDPDLGTVVDLKWIAGYFMTTDGTSLIVTELTDPTSVNPLKYGSAESDPDPIMAVDELRNEAYAIGRYTIEVFQNVGGQFFPFQVIEGAQIPKGAIGTHAYCSIGNTFVFLGSGRGEAPAVYAMIPGDTQKLSTREIDRILQGYSETQLANVVMECIVEGNHQFVFLHLPDQCLVYDTMASKAVGEQVWFTLDSGVGGKSTYRARDFVWCYDRWTCDDPTGTAIGVLTDEVSTHYGNVIGWEFGTQILYAAGNGAIIHELELACLPGRVALGDDPVIWTSYSLDGETWSREVSVSAGKQGERNKRIAWRRQGKMLNWRIQKFRGTSDAHLAVARLEAAVEPLMTRPRNG